MKQICNDFRGITVNVMHLRFSNIVFFHLLKIFPHQLGNSVSKKVLVALMLFRKCARQFSILIKEATLLVWNWLMSKNLLIGLALWGILNLLHSRNINPNIIELLKSWFLSSLACIRWNNSISNPVNIL